MNLIVPMAGRSSRYPNVKPKWMLTHPSGNFMVLEAISGLKLDDFSNIYLVYLREHEEKFHFMKGFMEEVDALGLTDKVNMVELVEPTRDQPETVYQAIKQGNIQGPIVIKDSDNRFVVDLKPGNMVCTYDLNQSGLIKPANKSYVQINEHGQIVNIIEKQVISSRFCVGAYGFEDASLFCDTLDAMPLDKERYISNVIFHLMLEEKKVFQAIDVNNYLDWGTIQDWDRFKRSYATLFLDLDGTLVMNSSAHFPPYVGESDPIEDNVQIIKDLQETGKFEIIITTSRPERFRAKTEAQLASLGLKPKQVIMGLYHSKRIIVNDYSKTNPYKSCDAINLKRNAADLREILRESLGIDYEEI
ncbi:MAG TPA: hypothetical protein DCE41_06295 [Cytophagales bacterium]|nr:hypothetical protein [Cytophagales bacterium]